jgi:hypothetical protein
MRTLVTMTLFFVGLQSLSGCTANDDPSSPEETVVLSYVDTLGYQVTDGVVLSFEGFKDTYGLSEPMIGYLKLKNVSCTTPFPLALYGSPPFRFWICPAGSEDIIYYYPSAIGFIDWNDTLAAGESLSYRCDWSHVTFNAAKQSWTDLKAYSGGSSTLS